MGRSVRLEYPGGIAEGEPSEMFEALKNLKEKAEEIAGTHGETISGGLKKAGDFIDDKTDGKYSDKIDSGVDKAQELIERMGDKSD